MIYYIPRQSGSILPDSAVIRLGLGHALRPGSIGTSTVQTQRGPDEAQGMYVGIGVEVHGGGGYAGYRWFRGPAWWVGWPEGSPPTEASLRRENATGTAVRLRDGADWIIPRIHAVLPDRPSCVPAIYGLDDQGGWTKRPDPAYRKVCELAMRYFQSSLMQNAENGLTEAEALDLIAGAIAINYHVSAVEIAAMGLLGTEELKAALDAVIDLREILERHKKKAVATPPTDSGERPEIAGGRA